MRLTCQQCTRHDAQPLAATPPGWTSVSLLKQGWRDTLRAELGIDVDCLGLCPACQERRATAFAVPLSVADKSLF